MVDKTVAELLLVGVLLDEATWVVLTECLWVLLALPEVGSLEVAVLDFGIDDLPREKLRDEPSKGKNAHIADTPLLCR